MSKEEKYLDLGNWKIELIGRTGYFTMGRVFHNDEEVKCRSITIRIRNNEIVTLDVDDITVTPAGDTE